MWQNFSNSQIPRNNFSFWRRRPISLCGSDINILLTTNRIPSSIFTLFLLWTATVHSGMNTYRFSSTQRKSPCAIWHSWSLLLPHAHLICLVVHWIVWNMMIPTPIMILSTSLLNCSHHVIFFLSSSFLKNMFWFLCLDDQTQQKASGTFEFSVRLARTCKFCLNP